MLLCTDKAAKERLVGVAWRVVSWLCCVVLWPGISYDATTHGIALLVDGVFIHFSSQSHLAELEAEDIPDEVVEQKDVVFSNIKDIYGFHTR